MLDIGSFLTQDHHHVVNIFYCRMEKATETGFFSSTFSSKNKN